ncbi:MAG: 16S rRNA (cytidine(1402)-2'-O)-methyltransferase [Muribaculaceae bacterium]|nr:16S rRNA (cytidine(1402)-2'-O)-methyltransferase [Muribaculaceae bacterium]
MAAQNRAPWGKLYVVPTPVGNLDDMAPRAIEVLRNADLILAEDTRTSGNLMRHFDIATPMVSHHKYNEHTTVKSVVERLKSGETLALVSDAGTPAISDPGFMLVRECRAEGIEVETLPGPTAFVPALVNSGLPCERFCFEGFLPPKKGRATRLAELAADERTFIIYESPLRLVKTLEELAEACGNDRPASVSREISKLHNTTRNGSLAELHDYFAQNNPKGEIVIVIAGKRDLPGNKRVHRNKYRADDAGDQA